MFSFFFQISLNILVYLGKFWRKRENIFREIGRKRENTPSYVTMSCVNRLLDRFSLPKQPYKTDLEFLDCFGKGKAPSYTKRRSF